MGYTIYIFAAVILAAISFFGFLMNFIVLFVVVKDSNTLWKPINVIIVNLATQDLLVAVFVSPLAVMSAVDGEWYWERETCIWYAWFMSTLGFGSIGSLTIMAVERWALVVKQMKSFSIRSALFAAGGAWMYALSMSTPPLFGWGVYGPDSINISCSVSWEIHDNASNNRSFITFLFILGLVLPIIIMTASYIAIIRCLKRVKKRTRSKRRYELKVSKMVAIMIIAFLIAWTPYSILALARQFFNYRASAIVSVLPTLLAKTSICYNPVIYVGLNQEFLKSFKRIFGIETVNERNRRRTVIKNIQTNELVCECHVHRVCAL